MRWPRIERMRDGGPDMMAMVKGDGDGERPRPRIKRD